MGVEEPGAVTRASRCVIVLGMHRSGTSALAGTLREAGIYFGKVLDRKFALNLKGLQEAPSVLYMHENLLEANGGSWHEPPEAIVWQPLHKAVRDLFVESRADQYLWGFKDPRTLLTLDGWLDTLPDLACAGIFRHPAEVASSINHRNGFDLEKCFGIWEHYNRRLLNYHRQCDFPIIEFVPDAVRMQHSLKLVLRKLGLSLETEPTFFDEALRHHEVPAIDVPSSALRLLADLRESAI